MTWQDLYKTDLTALSDENIKMHINALKKFRVEETHSQDMSVNECNTLLMLAAAEQQARSSSKLAKLALLISVASVVLSVLFVGVSG